MASSSGRDSLTLVQSDHENIRLLWKRLFDEAEENGQRILIKFFTDYPEVKQYFKTVPTEGELYNNPLVVMHGKRIMTTFNKVIENLENWETVCKLLQSLVDSHKNIHGVPLAMFQRLFRAMLDICLDIMGDQLTNDMLVCWGKFFEAVHEEISVAYGRKRLH